ncbi:STAS/SEC14 domain-containing protein [Mycobacterium europaeum]|uniref:STAS/SEC14 domain-containing protein n=1 Tax=Mycobacterium europaeum TaxID=761804 RepID=UPI002012398F|nr:STAS/SEC14 domain-containing protein [Mycobacterium europaeum]
MLRGFPDDVAAFAIRGHVTKADYDAVLIPSFEDKLTRHKKVRIYCEIASDLTLLACNWPYAAPWRRTRRGPSAVWADSKFGVDHYFDWDRCAVVSDLPWVKHVAKLTELLGFLWPGRYRTFSNAEAEKARQWISKPGGRRGAA